MTPGTPTDTVITGRALLEVGDLQAAFSQSPLYRRMRYLLFAIGIGVIVLSFIAVFTHQGFHWQYAVAMLVTLLVILSALHRGFRTAAQKMLDGKDARERDLTYTFDEAGYSIVSSASSLRGEWRTLRDWEEVPAGFLLYLHQHVPQIVPRRALQEGDAARLRRVLETQVIRAPG